MEIKDRIKLIMDKENMIAGVFADSIGVQQSTFSHVMNGRNRPSLDLIMKIHQRYPQINIEWLIYGKGEMEGTKTTHYSSGYPSLFDQSPEKPIGSVEMGNHKEVVHETSENIHKPTVIQEIKYVEKPVKRITEIRIFFDDNTYEIFRPEK